MHNILEKIKPTLNKVLSFFWLIAISLSIIWIASAAAPNPGHTIAEIGNVAQGDILYGSATDVISALAKSITATRYLSNTGASNNPAWAQVDLSNGVTGLLPFANGGYRNLVKLGADVINNNATANTLANCTGLSFSVASGTRYYFTALIWYTSAAATTGSRWTLNGPTVTNITYKSTYTLTATTITTNFATALSIPAASNATALTAGNIATIEGTILPSAAGTVVVQFASEVASSAITCKAGSILEWWQ